MAFEQIARAIKLILHSGTELSNKGVLLDTGRGAKSKTVVTKKLQMQIATKRQKRRELVELLTTSRS